MYNLNDREKQILRLVTKGTGNKKIGKLLNISVHTVKVYITSILRKLNVKNRTEAAFIAGKYKIIE